MVMKGGVGAGGSGGDDDAWARAGNGNGKANRRVPKPPAGDQPMAGIGSGSAPVNNPGRASYSLTRPLSPSGVTLGGGGGADPVPAWLKHLSKQLSDSSYPNFYVSSSNSNDAPEMQQDGSPPSSPPRFRKKARYSSPPPAAPPSSPERAPKSNVLPLPWATGAGATRFSLIQTSTPPLMVTGTVTGGGGRPPVPDQVSLMAGLQMSNTAANKTPAYISFVASGATSLGGVRGRGGALISPLGFSFRRSGGDQEGAKDEEVMTDKNADEDLELTLGNAETRKDRA